MSGEAPAQAPAMTDCRGVPITPGCKVAQRGQMGQGWYDPSRGALERNAGATGTVVKIGRTRVHVDFGRTKRELFGRNAADEPAIDSVAPDLLRVITEGEGR